MRHINFMGWRRPAVALSALLILISLVSLLTNGLQYSMEFTGGMVAELEYDKPVYIESVKRGLQSAGFPQAMVAHFGNDKEIVVRLPGSVTAEISRQLVDSLNVDGSVEVKRIENIGPQVAEDLREQAVFAVFVALACLMVYISIRFQFKFAVGAVVSLIHDVLIVLGVFALMKWEFDMPVFAAVLTVIGYSLNDTIVVFDRIRDNFRQVRKRTAEYIISLSINQTLERTILTSSTTLVVVVVLLIFGGEAILGFAKALIVGIVFGTFSSIYIAANVLLMMDITSQDLIPPLDERP